MDLKNKIYEFFKFFFKAIIGGVIGGIILSVILYAGSFFDFLGRF
jgi:prolipoprotein diacylglyceryltransferase|tara:strand:+ start:12817 stop:12951 length:135 start_codon:yes stop_codon:yes gene_type:complete